MKICLFLRHLILFCGNFFHFQTLTTVNSLPNDKLLDWSKLKAFADNKLNIAEFINSMFDRAENIVGKGENVGHQHFLLFPQCFQKASFSRSLKVGIVW